MTEENIEIDFTKLNIGPEARRFLTSCGDPKSLKELPEEGELHRLSFSGEDCPRKSCPCNTRHTYKTAQLCTSWSRRSSQLAKQHKIIRSARLTNNTSVLRKPILKLTSSNNKNSFKFIKLDNVKPETLFKENSTFKLISNLKFKKDNIISKKFGEKSVNSLNFKLLNNSDACEVSQNSARYSSYSFRDLRNTPRTSCEGVNLEPQQSCSQQARNVREDITINELASYFENLVHIPKKMSSMAEQMYT